MQEALLQEQHDLQATKGRLLEAVADTQRIMKMLAQHRSGLEADLQDKRHSLNIDVMCVDKKLALSAELAGKLDLCYSRRGVPASPGLPQLQGASRDKATLASESDGLAQERQRRAMTLRAVTAAMEVERLAEERGRATAEALAVCRRVAEATHRATQAQMAAAIEKTEQQRLELSRQAKLTDQKLAELQKCLTLTRDKLKFLDKPVSAGRERNKIRGQRTPREVIDDQVSEALHEQQAALEARRLQLHSKIVSMESALEELEGCRKALQEDLSDKDQALAVDRSCALTAGRYGRPKSSCRPGQPHSPGDSSARVRQASAR